MKNMKKFITLCGFLILGSIACGDVDIVKAEAINNQATDTSGYTITIPSDVDIDKKSGKGSFAVTGNVKAQSTIDVSIQSKNGYNLKNKSKDLPYNIDKKSFSFDNGKSTSDLDINEVFNISSDTNTNFSGNYEDRLTFNIESHKFAYKVDLNAVLDGKTVYGPHSYGVFDIYVNGELVASDVSDWEEIYPYGTEYEIKNIRATDGHHYDGIDYEKLKGRFGENGKTRITAQLKFDTNKLTVNYHADGAQSFKYFDNTIQNVDGKDIAYTGIHLYGNYYDAESGLVDVSRLTKKGYTAKSHVWSVGKNGNKEIRDDKGLSKVEDIANYCGVLDEFKKNDTTIDLYPIWIPNTYTLTYDLNGGSFNASTTQRFKYESEDAISSEIPIKSGYSFAGWKWGDVTMQPGDTIPKECGNFTLTAQWKKQYTLTFDANGGTVSETSRTITEGNQIGSLPTPNKNGYRFYGWYGISDGTDWQTSYLILGSSIKKQDLKIVASWGPPVETLAKQNESTLPDGIYKIYSGISSLSDYNLKPRSENSNDENQILLKKEDSSEYAFWQIEHDSSGFVMFKNRKTGKYLDLASAFATSKRKIQLYSENGTYAQKWIVVNKNGKYQIISAVNPNFVLDLSNATLDGGDFGVIQLYYDNGTFAQRWNFKQIYDTGTVLNIEGTEYRVIEQKENNKYLVMMNKSIGNLRILQSGSRSDGQNVNTYEGSTIDKHLENDWYNGLPSSLKAAILPINIKQASYATKNDSNSKQEAGPNGQIYNEINRHVYLPSVDDIGKVVDLKNPDKVKSFLNETSIWTRDSFQSIAFYMEYLDAYSGSLDYNSVGYFYGVRPAFVIDLSKIEATVVDTVNYK